MISEQIEVDVVERKTPSIQASQCSNMML